MKPCCNLTLPDSRLLRPPPTNKALLIFIVFQKIASTSQIYEGTDPTLDWEPPRFSYPIAFSVNWADMFLICVVISPGQ